MTNNKELTAVEWQFEQLFNSFEKFNNGEYTFDEYLKSNLEIRAQAKEMEEEQMIDFAYKALMEADMTSNRYVDVDKLYNKTYRGGE
jgi:hypothetical protein